MARDCKKPKSNSKFKGRSNNNKGATGLQGEVVNEKPKDMVGACQEGIEVSQCGSQSSDMVLSSAVENVPVKEGYVNGCKVKVVRDTGCNTVIVREKFVDASCLTGEVRTLKLLDGTVRKCPCAILEIDTPFFQGVVNALVVQDPLFDLFIGNIEGARDPNDPDPNWNVSDFSGEKHFSGAVETRGQKLKKGKPLKPLKVRKSTGLAVSKEDLVKFQSDSVDLSNLFKLAKSGHTKETRSGNKISFEIDKVVLFRKFCPVKGKEVKQVVVPKKLREQVMKVGHESPLSGHSGIKKTLLRNFYWPGIHSDVKMYCLSCDICQRTIDKGRVSRVPFGKMPLIDTPFRRVAIDLVGPLSPISDRGNRYILTMVDYATRFPEAIPLPSVETERVAEALLEIFTSVGFPQEILTDMGSQFTSDIMKEISRLLHIKQITTTPYHPMCNGLVERFNGTLKKMLKRMSSERPRDWDRYLPALLFAYREVPQESLAYSPFELLYGRNVRGPMDILRQVWTGEVKEEEVKTTYQYVIDLKERLEETCDMAQKELARSASRYRKYYDTRTRDRRFKVDDLVLLLLPTDRNKLTMQWKGPYRVTQRLGPHDYKVQVEGKSKTYHANLLKKYFTRPEAEKDEVASVGVVLNGAGSCVVGDMQVVDEKGLNIVLPPGQSSETCKDVNVNEHLSESQTNDVASLLSEFKDVWTDIPGKTNLINYALPLISDEPIRSKPYPLPFSTQKSVEKEIDFMLQLDIKEKSNSPYSSPTVLVRKKDGSYRFCVDFRKLNRVALFDPEPIPNIDQLMAKVGKGKYFTKIDLAKGYWQIPVVEEERRKLAFVTHAGMFQFKVMPFGVVNSSVVFTRMMRKLLNGMPNVINSIDDILIYSEDWDSHIVLLRKVVERLRKAELTARSTKCCEVQTSLEFLRFIVGKGSLGPTLDKVSKILSDSIPKTKKEVRSFIGMSGYYSRFIPNYAAIAAPLTDLTRSHAPNRVQWGPAQDAAFATLKSRLANAPILRLPDLSKHFILRCDASDVGIGAVLMQENDGVKHLVCYASSKLQPREVKYATIEECLALVWALGKFQVNLYGVEFLLETDHHPLAYIDKAKMKNSRVMRWALCLQPFRYIVRTIKGSENYGADFLSRCLE